MKAAIIDEAGASARIGDFPEPEPAQGEALLRVRAAAIHPIVRALASGTHYGSEHRYPLVPGVDGVGFGADGALRYFGYTRAPWGTLAERAAARLGLPLPAGADPEMIAGALNPGLSSWLPLTGFLAEQEHGGTPRALGTVVVLGATGVAGRLAVQSALALGATRVVGLGRDEARLAEVRALGAETVGLEEGASGIARALGGTAPAVVLDYLWGDAAETLWEALSPAASAASAEGGLDEREGETTHYEIGTAAGSTARLPGELLRSRRYTVRGSGAGSTPVATIIAELPRFMNLVAMGEIAAPIEVFPLSRVAEAWAYRGPRRAVVVPDEFA